MIRLRRSFKRLFLENFFLKVGSFVLAIVLWFIVQIQGKIEQKVDLKVDTATFQSLPDDGFVRMFKQSDDVSDLVSVRMKGIPSAMSKIAEQASLSIDLPQDFDDWGREVVFELTNKNIQNIPFGVEILNINPSTITVMLDYFINKEVKVTKEYVGLPPEGFKINNVRVNPEVVIISGPRSVVETISTVMARYINISMLNISHTQQVYSFADTPMIIPNFVTCDPAGIDLVFEIVEIMETKKFRNLVMEIKRLEGTNTIENIKPDRVSVVIEGPQNIIKNLKAKALRIILDVQELPPDKWRDVTPKIEFPRDFAARLKVKKFLPSKISVKVTKRNTNNQGT